MSDLVTNPMTLTITDCCVCGVNFAVPERLLANRREAGGSFYCPNGHSLVFTKTRAMQLEDELKATKARARHHQDQHEAAVRSNRALRGQITKERKRIANGVCPCCNRSFVNLQRHMSGQHPDFVGGSDDR